MLSAIKEEIKKQKAYLEAADIIFEDGSGKNLDDMIVLGDTSPMMEEADDEFGDTGVDDAMTEDGDETEDDPDDAPEPDVPDEDGPDNEDDSNIEDEPVEEPEEPEPIKSDDIADEPIEDPAENNPVPDPTTGDENGDIANEPVDGDSEAPLPVPGADELPEPVGRQTGDPVQDDNITDVTLDLQSNTIRDTLPVPPANAAEAIDGDTITSHVDSGFGGNGEPSFVDADDFDSPTPTSAVPNPSTGDESETTTDDPANESQSFGEAITIGDPVDDQQSLTAENSGGDSADGDIPPDAEPVPVEGADAGGEAENPVTAAVRDKVAESDSDGSDAESEKEKLLKKLGAITKNIEDAKNAIMDTLR